MTTVNNDPYIMVRDGVFSKDFCEHCVQKFEVDNRKEAGIVSGGVRPQVKKSDDLLITSYPDWTEEDNSFLRILQWSMQEYEQHLHSLIPLAQRTTNENYKYVPFHTRAGGEVTDTGFQIQRTLPGDGYVWHNDFTIEKLSPALSGVRNVTFIFYLNTVDEGWTQFYNGDQVAPVQGRVCLFPATWTYVHQGYPPKQNKYLCTGWIMEKI